MKKSNFLIVVLVIIAIALNSCTKPEQKAVTENLTSEDINLILKLYPTSGRECIEKAIDLQDVGFSKVDEAIYGKLTFNDYCNTINTLEELNSRFSIEWNNLVNSDLSNYKVKVDSIIDLPELREEFLSKSDSRKYLNSDRSINDFFELWKGKDKTDLPNLDEFISSKIDSSLEASNKLVYDFEKLYDSKKDYIGNLKEYNKVKRFKE